MAPPSLQNRPQATVELLSSAAHLRALLVDETPDPVTSSELFRQEAYLAAFDRLARREKRFGASRGDVPLSSWLADAHLLARRIAAEVAEGSYELSPLTRFEAVVGGKLRTLHRPELVDHVVLVALAEELARAVEPELSPAVHSYRRGVSGTRALRSLIEFARDHRRARAVTAQGLHVIRTDVARYGESIRVDDDSPLWPALAPVFERLAPTVAALVRRAIHQPVRTREFEPAPLDVGIPTGSPIQQPLANLYLNEVDHAFARRADFFYARFGDDLLLATEHADDLECAFDDLLARCRALGLTLRPEKTARLFWNGAGRSGPDAHFRGTPHVDYLGARLAFRGGVALNREKERRLFRAVAERLRNTARQLPPGTSLDVRGTLLARVVETALDPSARLAEPLAGTFHLVTDRPSRRRFARRLELLVVELLLERRGHRGFRAIAPSRLRAWGFPRLDQPELGR